MNYLNTRICAGRRNSAQEVWQLLKTMLPFFIFSILNKILWNEVTFGLCLATQSFSVKFWIQSLVEPFRTNMKVKYKWLFWITLRESSNIFNFEKSILKNILISRTMNNEWHLIYIFILRWIQYTLDTHFKLFYFFNEVKFAQCTINH